MATECNRSSIRLQGPGRREVRADFDAGDISSDGGVLILKAADDHAKILDQFTDCFTDHRDPARVEHTVRDLLAQRVFGLALGYEDLNDHDELRLDPLIAAAVGKKQPARASLAASSTLNRLELSKPGEAASHRYKRVELDEGAVDDMFVNLFVQAFREPPTEIVLDFDATDDPLHGQQEGRFFHGYYGHYCYLPLYVFCGDHLLAARLRQSNIDGAAGTIEELERLVPSIRGYWPDVKILVRGDSGFCRDNIMKWCEEHGIDFLLGLAKNDRLIKRIAKQLKKAERKCVVSGEPARLFKGLRYKTKKSWTRTRRVVAKAEHLPGRSNPRFVVTSIKKAAVDDAELYEKLYCARGDMENRIKEQQLFCFADRTSAHEMRANQVRLYLSSVAYTLLECVRRVGLRGTDLARAQCNTIRTKLLKIGAIVRITVRKVWVSMSSAFPRAALFRTVLINLRAVPG